MNEKSMMDAFGIISNAGDAFSKYLGAIQASEANDLEKYKAYINEANESLLLAHKKQTELLQDETRGENTELSLIMVHAQDHLMNAILFKEVVLSFNKVHTRLNDLEGK